MSRGGPPGFRGGRNKRIKSSVASITNIAKQTLPRLCADGFWATVNSGGFDSVPDSRFALDGTAWYGTRKALF